MPIRATTVAGQFYPSNRAECTRAVEKAMGQHQPLAEERVFGGIAPHAGWMFSGACAGFLFSALRDQAVSPETVVLFGAVHYPGVSTASLYGTGAWRTPLGDLAVDAELARAVLKSDQDGLLVDDPHAHAHEHSIEVQLPFVRFCWPEARILPLAIIPSGSAEAVGRIVARSAQRLGREIVVVGSSDLTHYGPRYGMAPAGIGQPALDWTHANDRGLLDEAVAMRPEGVLRQASTQHNACGAGAIAATIACCRELGAEQGRLLHYTTSHEVYPMGSASDLVGYGAVAYYH